MLVAVNALSVVAIGAVMGGSAASFAGVVSARGWRGAMRGRSRCDSCDRVLRWAELLPVASFLVLRGRCRSCRAGIGQSALVGEVVGVLGGAGLAAVAAATMAWP